MVVCKFYLQGNCRFGDSCKFEHQVGGSRQTHTSVLRHQNVPQSTNPSNVDTSVLIRSVSNDMQAAEKGGQWLLSCYAPFKEKANFPGFEDRSFEEVRFGFYEAQKNRNVEQYKRELQMALQDSVAKMRALKNPTPELVGVIRDIYNSPPQNSSASSFGNTSFGSTQSSVFGGKSPLLSVPSQQPSPFGNSQIVFGQNVMQQQQQQHTVYNSKATSVFAQPNQSMFGNMQNPTFGNSQQTSMFAGSGQNQNIFSNHFGQQNQTTHFGAAITSSNPLFNQQKVSPFTSMGSSFGPPFGQQNAAVSQFQTASKPPQLFSTQTSNMLSSQIMPNAGFQQSLQNSPLAANTTNIGSLSSSPFNMETSVSMFGSQQPNTMSTFGNQNSFSTQNIPSPFNFQTSTTGVAANKTNDTNNQVPNPGSFSHSSSIFGSNFGKPLTMETAINERDESFYSKTEELNEAEIKSFESDAFEFGKIPEKPPAANMCF